jgi:SRSO17 transposase
VLASLPRKSIEPMVLAVDGVAPKAVRAVQSFMSEGRWDDEGLLHQHWQEVETVLGADDGVLMVDGSDLPKQGVHAIGVKRQYCGALGKRATCQAGVCVGYGSPQGSTVLDRRLSMPAEWLTDDASAARRRQCGLPPEIACKTKPALAQDMLAAVVQAQTLRCRWVGADAACGGDTGFVEGVAGLGLWSFAAVPPHAGLGSAPGHPRPAVAWTRTPPAAGTPRRGRPSGAHGTGGGGFVAH